MGKSLVLAMALLALGGCGVADVGMAGAAAGTSKAEELRQAKQTEARVQQRLDAAQDQAAARLKQGEAATE